MSSQVAKGQTKRPGIRALKGFLTNLVERRTLERARGVVATASIYGATMLPVLAHAVSVDSPATAFLTLLSAGFAAIAGIGVVVCTIAGIFGFAQWTKLFNIMGWIVVGGGALSLATYGIGQAT